MSELTTLDTLGIDKNIYSALKNSLYPGAADESIMMVLSYCKAAKLDPMLKPVHIVPMQVTDKSKPKVNGYHQKEFRDIVMPGIGLYRIQAERTGTYAGISEPEFGEDITAKLGDKQITYPKWCKVTVKKILKDGSIGEFTATELWLENYATMKSGDVTPNAMWSKRPYAQLAKCAEAQALRKAFPELGAQPTAEEMEGKHIIEEAEEVPTSTTAQDLENKLNAKKQNPEKQEIIEDKSNAIPTIDMSLLIEKMSQSKSLEDLQALMPEINSVKSFAEKKELMEVYKKKFSQFNV